MYQGPKWTVSELPPARWNFIITILASFLFFTGWWIMIDAVVQYASVFNNVRIYHMPGIVATIAMICTNLVPLQYVQDPICYTDDTCCNPCVATSSLFICLMVSFGCVIGACFILCYDFLLDSARYQYPGYAICVQNVSIFACNMLIRFAKKDL